MKILDDILERYTVSDPSGDTDGKLLGASFIVLRNHDVVYSGARGQTSLETVSTPWSTNTFTWIASMTKLITSTCLMQLVESKKIGLDDDVRGLVPQLGAMQVLEGFDDAGKPLLRDNQDPITLRILLTHTTGLPYDALSPDLQRWSKAIGRTASSGDWTLEGFTTPLVFPPGTSWEYGTSIDWAGVVLEAITKDSLGTYLRRNIFEPLEMRDTGFFPRQLPHIADRVAAWAYRNENGTGLSTGASWKTDTPAIESGGSGLHSTAADYARFLSGLLGGRLVSAETLDEMFCPQLDETVAAALGQTAHSGGYVPEILAGSPLNHGLGGVINMEDMQGKRLAGSMMWTGATNGRWWIDRKTGIAAALVVNVSPYGDNILNGMFDELERAVYGELPVV
ncbi:beta-lactamase/transpeptidase-like protein [Plectosphaerella plurivora]|uniref:Beta-lactamase/transpeptidase-like protein n=1 Tax=Plectosphaerella plurivora TaxID=936078 RepID=A0A9P8VAD4_9PEZI|nr:beta-lactamase/transpeptidase-like protein [Plectosphaerella plurivora]